MVSALHRDLPLPSTNPCFRTHVSRLDSGHLVTRMLSPNGLCRHCPKLLYEALGLAEGYARVDARRWGSQPMGDSLATLRKRRCGPIRRGIGGAPSLRPSYRQSGRYQHTPPAPRSHGGILGRLNADRPNVDPHVRPRLRPTVWCEERANHARR